MKNILVIATAVLLMVAGVYSTAQTAQQSSAKNLNGAHTDLGRVDGVVPESGSPATVEDGFVIGTGDLLAINVWKETEISRVVPVRSDGKISLPLVGELQAGGRTPRQLETEIGAKLKDYISEPEVTVIVQEIHSQKFNVLGMVMRPGSYTLTKPMTVIDAIATAGGFRDFAKQKDMYVLRRKSDGTQSRYPFNYKDVVKGRNPRQDLELEPNDTIVVP